MCDARANFAVFAGFGFETPHKTPQNKSAAITLSCESLRGLRCFCSHPSRACTPKRDTTIRAGARTCAQWSAWLATKPRKHRTGADTLVFIDGCALRCLVRCLETKPRKPRVYLTPPAQKGTSWGGRKVGSARARYMKHTMRRIYLTYYND